MGHEATGHLAAVVTRNTAELMALPGVVGIAEGERDGRPCVVVFVATDAAAAPLIPAAIEGYDVIVERIGRFTAQR